CRRYVLAGPGDDAALFNAAKDALPLFPNAYVVGAHMTADGQRIVLADGSELTAEQFIEVLRRTPDLAPGTPLVFVMCKAGLVPVGGRSFADVVAEEWKADVWATDGDVWQTRLGKVVATKSGI